MHENLYQSIKQLREIESNVYYRVMITGYLNQDSLKQENIDLDKYIKNTMKQHQQLKGYIYIRGLFYVHILECTNINYINKYLLQLEENQNKFAMHNEIRIVHQIYQNGLNLFLGWQCDITIQNGPILNDTEKTEEQIMDRMMEIYEIFQDGAKKKKQSISYKIGTMIVLSNDDMQILISSQFMNLQQYCNIYTQHLQVGCQAELNYPLPSSVFKTIEFLETQDYEKFI